MDSSTSSSRSQEVNAVAASSSMLSVVIVFFIVVCLFEVNIFVFLLWVQSYEYILYVAIVNCIIDVGNTILLCIYLLFDCSFFIV